jgi:hypothetical protein
MSDELTVGAELDRAVGEAMGVEPVKWLLFTREGKEICPTWHAEYGELYSRNPECGRVDPVYPAYSTENAGPVLEWLAKRAKALAPERWHFTLVFSPGVGHWSCCIYRYEVLKFYAPGDTWQEAVCRAALAWKG